MMRVGFIFGLLALVVFMGCAPVPEQRVPATAIVRVTRGNPPETNDFSANSGMDIFNSYDFADHAGKTLELSKLWGVSDIDAATTIVKSLTVRVGNDPGSIVITLKGIEHSLAVNILNDLCTNAAGRQFSESVNGGKPEPMHISIIQLPK
ncbi:MAG TPA: hypothetical protein VK815_04650 [Candidatus Acidoferrales bacterium]|jgi:hypothetical protein|nr:hypothetical protein [Candidatus Acidoferrales bacterium]